MLDTRMTPISTRPRRPSSARPELRSAARPSEARLGRPHTQSASALRQPAVEPVRRALPSARTNRLARSEMRLMGLATACTAVACALLLVYLGAYARVTQLGIAQAQARTQLHQSQIRNGLLQAERSALECPQRIETAALAQGMAPRGITPVDYVPAQKSAAAQQEVKAQIKSDVSIQPGVTAPGWDQGSRGGTTEDSGAAASRSH